MRRPHRAAARHRGNVTIDWTVRENVRAHLRVLVKRVLRKYGYPPDKQERATRTVLEQAEVLSAGWATVAWRAGQVSSARTPAPRISHPCPAPELGSDPRESRILHPYLPRLSR
jgi:hypothetical protein